MARYLTPVMAFVFLLGPIQSTSAFCVIKQAGVGCSSVSRFALSSDYLENDLLAIRLSSDSDAPSRLCAVKSDGTVSPLCQREDDVETDLFVDHREFSNKAWQAITDDQVTGTYGEGWYGQRPIPSLGGGPGYGAEADEVWSVSEEQIETVREDGVDLPVLDVGIAHGEKARGGAF
jgi:hypothetical protein